MSESPLQDGARFKSSNEEERETVSPPKDYSIFTLVTKFSQNFFSAISSYLPVSHPDYSNLGYLSF